MKGMAWFRLYAEIINDPKTGTLSDAEFRCFIELMCLACEHGGKGETGLTAAEIDWKLRRNVSVTFQKLSDLGLIDIASSGKVSVKNWEKRQFKSDSSSDRVKKYREKTKAQASSNDGETLQKQDVNALDTDTDTDKKKTKAKKEMPLRFDEFWQAHPMKKGKEKAIAWWVKNNPSDELVDQIIAHLKDRVTADPQWVKNNGQFIPHAPTFLNQKLWQDEYQRIAPQGQGSVHQFPNQPQPRRRQELPRVS